MDGKRISCFVWQRQEDLAQAGGIVPHPVCQGHQANAAKQLIVTGTLMWSVLRALLVPQIQEYK